jgi:heme exporter protein B
MLKIFWHVFYIECLLLVRQSRDWLHPLCFFLMMAMLFPLAFTPDPIFLQKWLPGYIWLAALFANVLAMQTQFASDIEDGHLEQTLLTDIPQALLILAKLTAYWLVITLPLVLLTPLIAYLFGLSLDVTLILTLSLLLGTPIMTCIGSLCVALTLGLKQKGVLLGLLILPLVAPVLIFGVAIVQQLQAGFSISGPLAFLAGLDVLAILLFPLAIAATIKISVDD